MTAPKTIDVAVCTRDRAGYLADTLQALREAVTGVGRVIVVDNGSVDDTPRLLERLRESWPALTVLREPQPGLYHGRAAAIRASRADILLFVDDDVLPPADFLGPLTAAFDDPTVGVVGSAIEEAIDGPLPDWFAGRFLDHLPVLPVRGPMEECRYPCYPPGVFLAVRRAPCLNLYLAPERRQAELGHGGGALSGLSAVGGDDTDLCELYARAGFRIIRIAEITVAHRIVSVKLTKDWILRKFASDGRLRVRLARLRGKPGWCGETVRLLIALPALALLRPLAAMLPPPRAMMLRAYTAKSFGAWHELLFCRIKDRLPYP